MTRRAHQRAASGKLLLLLAVSAVVGVAGFWCLQNFGGKYRTLERLDPAAYYENANSLRGNTYLIEGMVVNALGANPDKGRLFSLAINSSQRTWVLPIFIPKELMGLNIQKNQRYMAKVKVNDQGLLHVLEISKP